MSDQLSQTLLGANPLGLSEDASFATPLTLQTIVGRENVAAALRAYAETVDRSQFDLWLTGDEFQGGVFTATTEGQVAQMLAVASVDEAGLATRIHMYGRPWPYM